MNAGILSQTETKQIIIGNSQSDITCSDIIFHVCRCDTKTTNVISCTVILSLNLLIRRLLYITLFIVIYKKYYVVRGATTKGRQFWHLPKASVF